MHLLRGQKNAATSKNSCSWSESIRLSQGHLHPWIGTVMRRHRGTYKSFPLSRVSYFVTTECGWGAPFLAAIFSAVLGMISTEVPPEVKMASK